MHVHCTFNNFYTTDTGTNTDDPAFSYMMHYKTKFTHFQGLLGTYWCTYKDHVYFQGLSKPRKSEKKTFKNDGCELHKKNEDWSVQKCILKISKVNTRRNLHVQCTNILLHAFSVLYQYSSVVDSNCPLCICIKSHFPILIYIYSTHERMQLRRC